MLRGGVFRIAVRVLPLALVVGLFGVSQADTASALGPAVLVSVTVTPAVGSVTVGDTQQFTATGTYSDLSTRDLTDSVTWSSSSSSTATVSNASGSQGLATGAGAGAATITATDSAALLSGTAALTVTPVIAAPDPLPPTLVTVAVTPALGSVTVGDTQQFAATGIYSDSSTENLTDAVTWSSSATGTATISNAAGSQGLATGVADGAVTITATDSAALISGTAALTVTPVAIPVVPPVLVSVAVTPAVGSVTVGSGEQFSATGIYSDSSTQDLTDAVTWSSSATGTATISNTPGSQGLATGVADGAVTVTATDSAALLSGTAALTVTPVAIPVLPPAPAAAQMALTPGSGWRRAPVTANGADFAPGTPVTVTYLSGLRARKRATTVLCRTVVQSNGTFSCHGTIPRRGRSGKRGQHTIEATGTATGSGGAMTTSIFDLARP